MRPVFVFLGLVFSIQIACGESIPEPIFYVSFDKGVDADKAAGSETGKLLNAQGGSPTEVPLTEGLCGKALASGTVTVRYSSEENLLVEAGTVSLWFKSLTWSVDDDKRHGFFGTEHVMEGERSVSNFTLYKWEKYALTPSSNAFILHITGGKAVDGQTQVMNQGCPIPHRITNDWEQGEWHFLAFTFDRKVGEAVFYADGVEAARTRQTMPESLSRYFYVGSSYNGETESTAIDEFRIWGRVLSADQIKGVYLSDRKKAR